jgi:hypothetical protein
VVRAKRLRRADPSDHGDDGSMQLAVMGDEAAYKALEESTVNAVHNLKNLYFSSFPLQTLMWWCKHKEFWLQFVLCLATNEDRFCVKTGVHWGVPALKRDHGTL